MAMGSGSWPSSFFVFGDKSMATNAAALRMNNDIAHALRQEAEREMARRSLLDYCRLVDRKYDTEATHIRFLADLLERVERGESEKVIITIMPRSGKSKLLSRFSSWWLGRNEGKSLLLLSASQSLSVRNSRWIRNDVMSEAYPWDVSIDETSSSILSWRTSTGNEVRAFSVGSILTGQGGHLILADDIQADAMSIGTRDSLEAWLRGVLETRREPGAPLVVLQNRWSTDDIVARLTEGPDGDSFEVINIEALCESPETDVLKRPLGESVWPSKWPVSLLEKKKKAVGSGVWDAGYMGRPTVEGGRLIPVSLFNDYDVLPKPPQVQWDPLSHFYISPLEAARPSAESFVRVTGIDTSGVVADTSKATGSWNAMVTCMLDSTTGDIFVVAMDRARNISFQELRTRVLAHLAMHGSDLATIENASQGGRLAESIRGMCRTPIQLVEARQSKEERVINVLPLLEGGKLWIPARAAWRNDFLKELGDFPASRSTDIVDAWAYAVAYCRLALARRRGDELFDEQIRRLEGGWMFSG
jgi:predicted phage terminase large subunit-like protein